MSELVTCGRCKAEVPQWSRQTLDQLARDPELSAAERWCIKCEDEYRVRIARAKMANRPRRRAPEIAYGVEVDQWGE